MIDRVRRQGGYTLVETIVAVTVGAIVMAAIFPVFLLLYRIETTWGAANQARATGLIAEDSLVRDVRAYEVVPGEAGLNRLGLRALGARPYWVAYSLEGSQLVRKVTDGGSGLISRSVVAHGIDHFAASYSCQQAWLQVAIWTTGISGATLRLEPDLIVTPRNQECP